MVIDVEHLPEEIFDGPGSAPFAPPARPALRSLAEIEREHVLAVLEACGGSQIEAATILGIGRTTLWRKLRAYS